MRLLKDMDLLSKVHLLTRVYGMTRLSWAISVGIPGDSYSKAYSEANPTLCLPHEGDEARQAEHQAENEAARDGNVADCCKASERAVLE